MKNTINKENGIPKKQINNNKNLDVVVKRKIYTATEEKLKEKPEDDTDGFDSDVSFDDDIVVSERSENSTSSDDSHFNEAHYSGSPPVFSRLDAQDVIDVMSKMKGIGQYVHGKADKAGQYLESAFAELFQWMTQGMIVTRDRVENMVMKLKNQADDLTTEVVSNVVIDKVVNNFTKHFDRIVDIIMLLAKFILRLSMSYPVKILLTEFTMDFTSLLAKIIGSHYITVADQIVPNATVQPWVYPLSGVFATLMAIFETNSVTPFRFSSIWRGAYSLANYLGSMVSIVPTINKNILSYNPEKAFPRTIAFADWLDRFAIDKDISAMQRRRGIACYHGYLEERKEWTRLDLTEYFQVKYPLLFGSHSSLLSSFPKMRMQPICILLQGKAGVGKTRLMNALQNFVYKLMQKYGIVDQELEYADFSYCWSPGKKHFDGYHCQPCFVMNDFGLENESASDADAASIEFVRVVDSNPYLPSMASLDDKGVSLQPLIVFASTMIDMERWPAHFKKCSREDAMIRRVTLAYEVSCRSWDNKKKQMQPKDGFETDDQWLITDVSNKDPVTIDQVCFEIQKRFLDELKNYRQTFDQNGMMKTPTMDKVLFDDYQDPYWAPVKQVNDICNLEPPPPRIKDEKVKWWTCENGNIAKSILQFYSAKYKNNAFLINSIGLGIAFGLVSAYLCRSQIKQGLTSAKEFVGDKVNKAKNKIATYNAQDFVNDKVAAAQETIAAYNPISLFTNLMEPTSDDDESDNGKSNWVKDQIIPNQLIGSKPYTHYKATINGKKVSCWLEDVVQPQSAPPITSLLNSQLKRKMTGKVFPSFSQQHNFVSCLGHDGTHAVWGIALDTQHLLITSHYLEQINNFDFITAGNGVRYTVFRDKCRVHPMPDIDQVLIRLFDVVINRGRMLWNKFTRSPTLLPSQQLQRVSPIEKSLCQVRTVSLTKAYGTMSGVTCTSTNLPGQPGMCGSVYIDNSGDIVGIHVAGNESGTRSYMTTLPYARLCAAMKDLADVAPPVNLVDETENERIVGQMDESAMVLDKAGIDICATAAGPYSPINRRSNLVKIPVSSCLPDLYEVAPLGFKYLENSRDPVELYRLNKWAKAQQNNLLKSWTVDDAVIKSMALQLDVDRADELLPWSSLAQSANTVPSITRATCAGPWFPGHTKHAFCIDTEQEPKLKDEFVEFLQQLEIKLLQGIGFPTVSGLSLKVERLPREKVEAGKTRLFQPVDICKYMIDRRYFGNIIAQLHLALKRDTGVVYAATPIEIAKKVKKLGNMVQAVDVASQDNSHMHNTTIIIMKLLIKTGLISNDAGTYYCHPDLPLLTKVNRVRYILLRDTGFGQRVYVDKVFDNCSGALASGSLWTTLFNSLAGWYCIECYCLYHHPIKFVLFGDDVLTDSTANPVKMREVYKNCGFEITGVGSDDMIIQQEVTEAVFCGRVYNHEVERMNLTFCRLAKIINFASLKDTRTAYIASLVNFISELCWENSNVYHQVMNSVVCNNIGLISYLPTEILNTVNVRTDSFWSSKTSYDDEMSNYDYLCMCASLWFDDCNLFDVIESKIKTSIVLYPEDEDDEVLIAQMDDGVIDAEVPEVPPVTDETGSDMVSIVTTDTLDVSKFDHTQKEIEYSFVKDAINPFWSRPVRIANVTWTSSNARNEILTNFVAFSDVMDAATNFQLKLANTVGIKGTLRVFCIVNSNPFQAGGLVLFGSPGAQIPNSIGSVMSGPHSVIMAGANQTASLDIPYNRELLWSPSNSYAAENEGTFFDWVRIQLRVLVPLEVASGSPNTVNVQILVQLIDMEVMQGSVTLFSIEPQSKQAKPKQGKGVAVVDKAEATSGALVRTIGNIAKMVSSVVSIGAMFMSKSDNVAAVEPISIQTGHSIANYNGVDESKKAALNASACTVPHPQLYPDSQKGPPTLIKNIASRPGLVNFYVYSTSTNADDILVDFPVVPQDGWQIVGDQFVYTPCAYIASHFTFWRGTITYRFTLFKTAYHSGSLELLVDYGGINRPTNASRSVNLHRVYWDITSQSVLTVSIPYIRPTHWSTYETRGDYFPIMYLKAIQPLIANSNVSQSITIMAEQWSPDLQVAWVQRGISVAGEEPRQMFLSPGQMYKQVALAQAQRFKSSGKSKEVRPQMMSAFGSILKTEDNVKQGNFDPAAVVHELSDHVILGIEKPKPDQDDFAYRYIAGDEVVDVTQVLKRFMNVNTEDTGAVKPPFVYNPNLVFATENYTFGNWPFVFESLSALFVYGTGGYRVKFVPSGSDRNVQYADVILATPSANASLGNPQFFQNSTNQPVLELDVPNVSRFFYYRLAVQGASGTLGSFNRPPQSVSLRTNTDHDVEMFFAFDDMVSWGGANYLPEIAINGYALQQQPAPLF